MPYVTQACAILLGHEVELLGMSSWRRRADVAIPNDLLQEIDSFKPSAGNEESIDGY